MTKLHKDIAVRLIQCTEDEEFTDQATIKVSLPLKHSKSSPLHLSLSFSLLTPSPFLLSFSLPLSFIQDLSVKTLELINNLKSLAPEGEKLSLDVLHARKLTPATENFLYSLASVEGLTQL